MPPPPPDAKDWVVLIVDDQLDNILIAKAALEFFGAKVETAASGAEALRILESLRPTVILLDLAMPVMDGYQLHQRLRQLPSLDGVPIIALTANALHTDRIKVLEAGFDAYITKPYEVMGLVQHISDLINKHPPPST